MNLFDDSTARNLESSLETMTPAHDTHSGGPAVIDAPEHAQPSPAELTSAPDSSQHDAPENHAPQNDAPPVEIAAAEAPEIPAPELAAAGSDDFAAALHSFETETEEAVGNSRCRSQRQQ